jgi:hypothetical protein
MDLETLETIDIKIKECKGSCISDAKDIKGSVDDKISKIVFFWIIGILCTITGSTIGFLNGRISTIEQRNNDVYYNLSNRLTAIETNTANTNKTVEQLQKFFAGYTIKETK